MEKEKKGFKIVVIIMLTLLMVALGGSIALNVITMQAVNKTQKTVRIMKAQMEEEADEEYDIYGETTEDDVRIADEYWIRSTRELSDAYKNGEENKLSDDDQETLDIAKKVIDEVIEDGMSDYDKEYAIYNWMCDNLGNEEDSMIAVNDAKGDKPHDVLKYHSAVCVGYATTFRLFMEMLDIDCKVVHNTDCYHSWDLVKIGGDWYHVDVYSGINGSRLSNFNMNDDIRNQVEDWDMDYFPEAASLAYNPMFKNRMPLEDVSTIPEFLKSNFDNRFDGFALEISMENAQMGIAMLDIAQDIFINNPYPIAGFPTYISYTTTMNNDKMVIMVACGDYYEDSDFDDPDYPDYPDGDIDYDQLRADIMEYFGQYGFTSYYDNSYEEWED